jgi:hypothetical protein
MASESGYSNQKKKGLSQFKTIHSLGSDKFGTSVASKALFEKMPSANIVSSVDVDGANGQAEYILVGLPSHGAILGDILRIDAGDLINHEFDIVEIVDTDFFKIPAIVEASLVSGVIGSIMGWVTNKANADGSQIVTVTLPGAATEAKQDDQITQIDVVTGTDDAVAPSQHFMSGAKVQTYSDHENELITVGAAGDSSSLQISPIGALYTADNYTHQYLQGITSINSGISTKIGSVTEVAPITDISSSGLNGRLQRIAQRLTSLIGLLPLGLGQTTSSASLAVVLSTEQEAKIDLLTKATDVQPVSGAFYPATQPVSGPLTDTQLRAKKVQVGFDPGTIDVFGRVIVGRRINQVDVQFFQGTPASLVTVTTVSTGSAVQDAGGGLFSTGTGVSGEVKGVSGQSTTYSAGAEIFMEVTASFVTPTSAASFQRIGLFDTNEGLYFGYTGLDFGVALRNNAVDTFVPKAFFSEDTLIGAADSKFTRNGIPEAIDLTKQNVWRLRFGWQGSAPIFYEVMSADGHFVTVHVIRQPNLGVSAHIRNPNLPITVHLKKTASDATNLQLKTNSWGAGASVAQTKVNSTITDATLVETNRSILTGVTTGGGGGYVNVKVTPSGALVTDATVSGAVSITALTPTYQEKSDVDDTVKTFTAPAGAKWCKIQADDTNTANVRVKIGGVATNVSGLQFQPGRSEDFSAVGNISVVSESFDAQKIYVQFGA